MNLQPFALPMLALPRWAKRFVVTTVDAGLCILSVWLAYSAPMGFSRSSVDALAFLPSASALAASSRALHEWLGILASRLGAI